MLSSKERLVIKTPYLEEKDGRTFLSAEIVEGNETRVMFFAVDNEYAKCLTYEVADCFLVAVLTHALTEGLDIVSEAPISRHLLYSLKTRLIPELAKHTKRYRHISVTAEPSDVVFKENHAVGMGWSGGVDCLYTFMHTYRTAEQNHRLTHLVNINAGVFEGNEKFIRQGFLRHSEKTKAIAEEFNLKSIDIDTNIQLLYHEFYLSVGPQRLCAGVLALQKLFSKYYISSAYEVLKLSFDEENSFYYEFTLCSCFRTQNLRFIDFGSETSRINKLDAIADDPFAQKNLHACIYGKDTNCLRCVKCVRTIAALYALGKLDRFSEAFDLERVERELDYILGDTYYHRRSQHYGEALALMEKKGMKLSRKALDYAAFLSAAHKAAEKHKDVLLDKPANE